jgi:hypothetical protein
MDSNGLERGLTPRHVVERIDDTFSSLTLPTDSRSVLFVDGLDQVMQNDRAKFDMDISAAIRNWIAKAYEWWSEPGSHHKKTVVFLFNEHPLSEEEQRGLIEPPIPRAFPHITQCLREEIHRCSWQVSYASLRVSAERRAKAQPVAREVGDRAIFVDAIRYSAGRRRSKLDLIFSQINNGHWPVRRHPYYQAAEKLRDLRKEFAERPEPHGPKTSTAEDANETRRAWTQRCVRMLAEDLDWVWFRLLKEQRDKTFRLGFEALLEELLRAPFEHVVGYALSNTVTALAHLEALPKGKEYRFGDLRRAVFSPADLSNSSFFGCDLRNAYFEKAPERLRGIKFVACDLTGTIFDSEDPEAVSTVESTEILGTSWDDDFRRTRIPIPLEGAQVGIACTLRRRP